MILNPSDPTGLGLFSKCARNQASKLRSHRPATANRSKTAKSTDDHSRKKTIAYFTFNKQQSREQRQSKFKRDQTPPVGQYNPIKLERPKLVWDILKVYHQNEKKKNEKTSQAKQNNVKSTQSITIVQPSQETQQVKANGQMNSFASLREQTQMSSVNKSQCVVNMSRMTGRKDETFESVDWGQANVMQSVGYVKRNLAKNIYFGKQPKATARRYETINPASNYSYDYNIVKPKRSGLLDFSIVKGRQQKPIKNQYAYQHYEYNNYVWQSTSTIYPNTKTHLIQFKKQINRNKKEPKQQTIRN